MSVDIIRAGSTHIGQLAPLFSAYRLFYEQSTDPEAEKTYLYQRLQNAECVIFLALRQDRPAGFVLLYPTFDSVMLGRVWVLHDLYVDTDHRRLGLGRSLMEKAHTYCRKEGASRVDLSTAVCNTVAQPLYESMGYERDIEFYVYSLNL